MATTINASCYITECKKTPSVTCLGCPNLLYCNTHFKQHRHDLNVGLQKLIDECNQFQGEIETQIKSPETHILIKTIDEWEEKSIVQIKAVARETREELLPRVTDFIPRVKVQLESLRSELNQDPDECEFVDVHIKSWTKELDRLKFILNNPPYFSLQKTSAEFINKIQLEVGTEPRIPIDARWKQNGVTVAGGNGKGDAPNQLYKPHGLFIDDDQTVIVGDFKNHRIIQWKNGDTGGKAMAGGNGQGDRLDQLNRPTDVLIDKETNSLIIADWCNERVIRWSLRNDTKQGEILIDNIDCCGLAIDDQRCLYVSDYGKHEVRRYQIGDKNGILVAGGNGKGNGLDQLNKPTYLFVDHQQNVYVSDNNNHRIMKWNKGAKEGIIVAGGNGNGSALTQLSYPSGILVDRLCNLYVADTANKRVIRWSEADKQGTIIIDRNNSVIAANQFGSPTNVFFDRHGNLYVVDYDNHCVQRFDIE